MRNAIIELVFLVCVAVLWTLFVGPRFSAYGMNWLNVLVYVAITAESTRLCATGRTFFAGRETKPQIADTISTEADANKNAAQDRAALRKVS